MVINENERQMVLEGEKADIYSEEIDLNEDLCFKEDAVACIRLVDYYTKKGQTQKAKKFF